MRHTKLILGLLLLAFTVHAEPHGATGGPAAAGGDLSKVPEIGLVEKKVAARNGEEEFALPDSATQRLDNWYREHQQSLSQAAWNDPNKVSDDKVKEIKQSLGSYLLSGDKEKFAKSVKIGVSASGMIKVEFPKTGQSFSYTPGPEDKYRTK